MGVRALWVCLVLTLACGRGPVRPAGATVDPALLEMVPADTVMLTGIRVESIRKTPLFQKYGGGIGQALDSLAQSRELDLLRQDLKEVLLASNGKATVVVGQGASKRQPLSANLRRGIAGVSPAAQIWAVGLGGSIPGVVPNAGNLGNLGKVFGSMAEWRVGITLSPDLELDAAGTAATEEDAKKLTGAMKFLIGSGRLHTPDNKPEMLQFYDAFQVRQDGQRVSLQARIGLELLEKAIASPPGSPLRD